MLLLKLGFKSLGIQGGCSVVMVQGFADLGQNLGAELK